MSSRIQQGSLNIDSTLYQLINEQVIPGTGIVAENFWQSFAAILKDLAPKNRALLIKREDLQHQIDVWHQERAGQTLDPVEYKQFLQQIGYLVPEGDDFEVTTASVEPEIATQAGPQLVVPIMNARFALNAANARWGSLYDALYGTDVISEADGADKTSGYNPVRGAKVVAYGRQFLDDNFPLQTGSHADATSYRVEAGSLLVEQGKFQSELQHAAAFCGSRYDEAGVLVAVLLKKHGLHVEVQIDPASPIGKTDLAGVKDLLMESAVSNIQDCEDSVAAVDAADKVLVYRNWLGLMRGDLEEVMEKGGKTITRKLSDDLTFTAPDGGELVVKGRALMLVRNVGHLMTNPAVLTRDGGEVFEGLMDAMITTLIAMHDLQKSEGLRNSHHGSVYVVKPKMHGPEEVAFADEIFTRVERTLGLPANTVKLGIMDEERRTTVNLKQCIFAAKSRVAFINTGFLDRTGDEIHTSMEAGPFSRKDFIKRKAWIGGYENRNVDIGLECGLSGRAQIGKGMWAMPDLMAAMIEQKIEHPKSGANCAWVPSPTAATLHALHYHKVDVFAVQDKLKAGGRRAHVETILDIPLATYRMWSEEQIMREVENNAQGILGYVVRWIDQGVGCSKVPDMNNVGLMEDRATCRISSQALANWLHHGVVSEDAVMGAMKKMAAVVDAQNAQDASYTPMAPGFDGIAFQACCDLVFKGRVQPSGYTEPVLHARRLELKAS